MQEHSSTRPLYVAIDIGKNVHTYGAYAGEKMDEVQAPTEVLSQRSGYSQFASQLHSWINSGKYQPVLVGLEPTGIYHESWIDALGQDFGMQIELRQLNPLSVRLKREQLHGGRKKKSDALDSKAIAACLHEGLGYPARPRQAATLRFSLWSTALRQTQQALYRVDLQVQTQIERLWPGMLLRVAAFQRAHPQLRPPEPFVRTRPLYRKAMQLILTERPNPHDWLPASPTDIAAFFQAHHVRISAARRQTLLAILERSLFPAPEIAQLLVAQLQQDFHRFLQLLKALNHLLRQAEELVPLSPAAVLTTIPGVASFLAAQYAAFVGDITRFQSADQIWSLAGLDPVQHDSGDRRRVGKLSKRGDGAFRHVLFSLGVTTCRSLPPIAAARRRAQRHGKGKVGAILHAAHKANRLCFRLLRDQIPFDPNLLH